MCLLVADGYLISDSKSNFPIEVKRLCPTVCAPTAAGKYGMCCRIRETRTEHTIRTLCIAYLAEVTAEINMTQHKLSNVVSDLLKLPLGPM